MKSFVKSNRQARKSYKKSLFQLGGGAKFPKKLAQKLLAVVVCTAMVLLGVPLAGDGYVTQADYDVITITVSLDNTTLKLKPNLDATMVGRRVKFKHGTGLPNDCKLYVETWYRADIDWNTEYTPGFIWPRLVLNNTNDKTLATCINANGVYLTLGCDEPIIEYDYLNSNVLTVCAHISQPNAPRGVAIGDQDRLNLTYDEATELWGKTLSTVPKLCPTHEKIWCNLDNCEIVFETTAIPDFLRGDACYACENWETLGTALVKSEIEMRTDPHGTTYSRVAGDEVCFIYDQQGVNGSSGSWFGVNNSDGTFPMGSILHIRLLKYGDLGFEELYSRLDVYTRDDVDKTKLMLLDLGVTGPDGNEITSWDGEVELYVPVDSGWTESDIKACFLSKGDDENISVSFDEMFFPDNSEEPQRVMVLKLRHFSPYLIYDELTDEEKESLETNSKTETPKTGDAVTTATVASLGMILVMALGIMLRLASKKKIKNKN